MAVLINCKQKAAIAALNYYLIMLT